MISIQQMTYIVNLNETKSFSSAAVKSFVTQPTLSMQIKKAEEVLGFSIFDRESNLFSLTPKGEQLIPIIEQILHDYSEINYLIDNKNEASQERIKIGVIPTIANFLIEENYSEWKNLLDMSILEIEEGITEELIERCEQKKLDAIILAGPARSSKLLSISLFEEEMLLFTSEKINENKVTINQIQEWKPWLLSRGNCLRTQMMEFCSLKNENSQNWNYQGGNIELLMRMVIKEGGYTLVPSFFASHLNKLNEMKHIVNDFDESPARQVICCVLNKGKKWQSVEKIIRSIQHKYAKSSSNNLKLLNWE